MRRDSFSTHRHLTLRSKLHILSAPYTVFRTVLRAATLLLRIIRNVSAIEVFWRNKQYCSSVLTARSTLTRVQHSISDIRIRKNQINRKRASVQYVICASNSCLHQTRIRRGGQDRTALDWTEEPRRCAAPRGAVLLSAPLQNQESQEESGAEHSAGYFSERSCEQ